MRILTLYISSGERFLTLDDEGASDIIHGKLAILADKMSTLNSNWSEQEEVFKNNNAGKLPNSTNQHKGGGDYQQFDVHESVTMTTKQMTTVAENGQFSPFNRSISRDLDSSVDNLPNHHPSVRRASSQSLQSMSSSRDSLNSTPYSSMNRTKRNSRSSGKFDIRNWRSPSISSIEKTIFPASSSSFDQSVPNMRSTKPDSSMDSLDSYKQSNSRLFGAPPRRLNMGYESMSYDGSRSSIDSVSRLDSSSGHLSRSFRDSQRSYVDVHDQWSQVYQKLREVSHLF